MFDDVVIVLGIDFVEICLCNVVCEGDVNLFMGKCIYSVGLLECFEKGWKIFEWEKCCVEC